MKHFRKVLASALLVASLALAGTIGPVQRTIGQGMTQLTTMVGTEQIPLNYPCTVSCFVTASTLAGWINALPGDSAPRNVLIGGDYGTNPFQRGTSNGSAHISNTTTYGPDSVAFLGGASSQIDWSQQTGASDVPTGFSASLRFQRFATNADTAAICKIQVLDSLKSVRFQGQSFALSFWAKVGANFSAASNNMQVTVAYGTGTNQSAANFAAGSWTNQTNAYQANTALTTSFVRYTITGSIPVQVSSTNVNQVGIKYCFTPVGTAGANDWIEFAGEQLEVTSTTSASAFDYHDPATELNVAQRRLIVINEPASGIGIASGFYDGGTSCLVTVALPDTMAAAPTVTFAGTALSASTWRVRITAANVAVSTPFLAAGTGHSTTNINLTATTGAQTGGTACQLQGLGGGSKIVISAEL